MKLKQKGLLLVAFALLVLCLFPACNKPDFNKIAGVEWDPNAAVPLGYADFGVYDVLAAKDSNNLIIINPLDGSLALVYDGQIVSVSAQQVVPMSNYSQQFNETPANLSLAATGSFNSTISSAFSENIDVPMSNGIELHTMNFTSGSLDLNFSTTLQQDITLAITFPDLISGGVPVTKNVTMTYGGSVPTNASTSVNLAGVTADFTAGGSTVNRLRMNINSTVTGTGQPITGSESFSVSANLNNMVFTNATGYFGQQNLGIQSDSILIKIFNNATSGTFAFTNPTLKLTVNNSFGIPIDMGFSNLQSINVATGQVTPLSGYPNSLSVPSPASMGQSTSASITMTTANTTNLSTIVSSTPKYLSYSAAATTNPAGQTATLNFVESTSKFTVDAELTLPLEGFAYGFSANDTMPFNMGGNSSTTDQIDWAMIRFNVTNGFPVSVNAQVTFVDSNYVPLFTLVPTPVEVISAAPVNSLGKVTNSVNKITDIMIDKSNFHFLNQVKHVIINGTGATTNATTTPNTIVKFYDGYRLSFKLGVQVQANVKQHL